MSEIDEGEVKKVSDDEEDEGVEFVGVDNTANQYFEFALPTRGWAQDTAKRLGLPQRQNFNLPEQPMEPVNTPPPAIGCPRNASPS